MSITAQVSLRPIRRPGSAPAKDKDWARDIFRRHGLEVDPDAISILVSGEPSAVFSALQECIEETASQGYVAELTIVPQAVSVSKPEGKSESVMYRAIGRVENMMDEMTTPEVIRAVESRIVLDPSLAHPGLAGIRAGDNLLVVFWFDRSEGYELRVYPRGDRSRPERGVFATHTPRRPNPIGLTKVRVLAVEENVLFVRGLDALNGTPVLDIKSA